MVISDQILNYLGLMKCIIELTIQRMKHECQRVFE